MSMPEYGNIWQSLAQSTVRAYSPRVCLGHLRPLHEVHVVVGHQCVAASAVSDLARPA